MEPLFRWDAKQILTGSVVPTNYIPTKRPWKHWKTVVVLLVNNNKMEMYSCWWSMVFIRAVDKGREHPLFSLFCICNAFFSTIPLYFF